MTAADQNNRELRQSNNFSLRYRVIVYLHEAILRTCRGDGRSNQLRRPVAATIVSCKHYVRLSSLLVSCLTGGCSLGGLS